MPASSGGGQADQRDVGRTAGTQADLAGVGRAEDRWLGMDRLDAGGGPGFDASWCRSEKTHTSTAAFDALKGLSRKRSAFAMLPREAAAIAPCTPRDLLSLSTGRLIQKSTSSTKVFGSTLTRASPHGTSWAPGRGSTWFS